MSNLTIGLAMVAGLVLAGVVAHGAWVARKSQPRQADPQGPGGNPSVEAAEGARYQEPSLDGVDAPLSGVTGADGPALGADPGAAVSGPSTSGARPPVLDALIDSLAHIPLDAPLPAEGAMAAMPATRRVGSKPFHIEGLNAATGQWEQPAAGQHYSAFQAGVQLANRTGALKDIEFSEFLVKTQAFADALGASTEFSEMRDELARARELDQFAGSHDAQLSFTLRARGAAWSPGFVTQCALRLGFVPGVLPGRLVLPAAQVGLPPVLDLQIDAQAAMAEDPSQSALREAVLSLDVPQVARAERPFQRMRETATALVAGMDALLTDDNGQPLGAEALDGIGGELEKLYDALESRDMAAGSLVARRVFS